MAGERLNSMFIDLRARTLKLERDLKTANGKIARSGRKLGGSLGSGMGKEFASTFSRFLGAAVIGAQIKKAIDFGSEISDLATGARVGTTEFQILAFAMKEAGGEMGNMANALAKIQKNVSDASRLATMKDALANLNLSYEEMRGLDPARMFAKLAEGIKDSPDDLKAYAAAMDLLGSKNAPRLMEVLQRLSTDGFEKVGKDARDAGAIMSGQVVKDMDTLADHAGNLGTALTVWAGSVVSAGMGWFDQERVILKAIQFKQTALEKILKRGDAEDSANVEKFRKSIGEWQDVLRALQEHKKGDDADLLSAAELQKMEEAAEEMDRLTKLSEKLKESLKSPLQLRFEGEAELANILSAGLITWDEFSQAHQKLMEDYQDKMKEGAGPVAEAWERTSERMATSLSEAFIEGGDALDKYLARALRAMAAAAIEQQIMGPILGMLGGDKGLGGVFKKFGGFLGFAGGGRPPVGVPSIVGERGPEVFVPRSAGTIIPNHKASGFGGGSTSNVVINQTINFNTDLAEVRNQISQAAPLIASATQTQLRDSQLRGQ